MVFSVFQEQDELNLELLVKDEPIDWEESIDPSETLTIDHEIDIKPVSLSVEMNCECY